MMICQGRIQPSYALSAFRPHLSAFRSLHRVWRGETLADEGEDIFEGGREVQESFE